MTQPSPFYSNNRFYNNISILNCQYISLHARTIFVSPPMAVALLMRRRTSSFTSAAASLHEGLSLCHGAETIIEKAYSLARYQSIQ
jgi:hypothetical protein